MIGALTPRTVAELAAAGIAVAPVEEALGALLTAAEAHGLACHVARTRRGRCPGGDCACYRARVRPIPARRGGERPDRAPAARGWGETGAAALARALLAWLA